MNPGLPGAGIGGLFYVLSALWMPICELWRLRRGDARGQWPLVARQFAIAVGIIVAMSGVFWALDTVLILKPVAAHARSRRAPAALREGRAGRSLGQYGPGRRAGKSGQDRRGNRAIRSRSPQGARRVRRLLGPGPDLARCGSQRRAGEELRTMGVTATAERGSVVRA